MTGNGDNTSADVHLREARSMAVAVEVTQIDTLASEEK